MDLYILAEFWDFNEVLWGVLLVIYRIMLGTSDRRLFGIFKGFYQIYVGLVR